MNFVQLAETLVQQQGRDPHKGTLLCFDPGHTTGWCAFVGWELVDSGQIDTTTPEVSTPGLIALYKEFGPDTIVLESYRVYKWKAKHHAGSELPTARVIGAMEFLAVMHSIPLYKQPANVAKNFCTDKKLVGWDFWKVGEKHARDAIRHGAYFLLFGPTKGSGSRGGPVVG